MHIKRWTPILAFFSVLFWAVNVGATPVTIQQFILGESVISDPVGQSVTTPSGGPWNNIQFNWFSDLNATTPAAYGSIYLLSQSYSGAPSLLSSSTPGYIADASAAGGFYTFASSVTLQPNTQYFFYESTGGSVAFFDANGYAGGNMYVRVSVGFVNFAIDDALFRLTGELPATAAVPEVSSCMFLIFAISSLAWMKRRTQMNN